MYTCSIWIKPVSASALYVYTAQFRGLGSSQCYSQFLQASSRIYARIHQATDSPEIKIGRTAPPPTAGVWQNIIFTWDGTIADNSGIKIYVNGVRKDDTNEGTSITAPNAAVLPFIIGAQFLSNGTRQSWVNGSMSTVLIFKRALSPSEIQQLYIDPYCFIKPQTDWNCIQSAVAGGVIKTYNGLVWSNISKINGIVKSSIKTLNGVNAN